MASTDANANAADRQRLLRVHEAAGLALLQFVDAATDAVKSKWVPYASPSPTTDAPRTRAGGAGRLDLDRLPSACGHFQLVPPPRGVPQNLLIFLHGRGDSHEPFAKLGATMALPQTAVVSLRAPLELPFDLGATWLRDLDEAAMSFIPPGRPHKARSQSLDDARDHVQRFLSALRDDLGWDWTRVFLFGFSQGAAVAFHLSMTTREPLGGVVLVAGGVLAGSHTASYTFKQHGGEAEATPMLLIAGAEDDEYPQSLVRESRRQFAAAFPSNAGAFECEVIPDKGHAMVSSPREMRVVMAFLAKRLHLSDTSSQGLEQRDDIIELQG